MFICNCVGLRCCDCPNDKDNDDDINKSDNNNNSDDDDNNNNDDCNSHGGRVGIDDGHDIRVRRHFDAGIGDLNDDDDDDGIDNDQFCRRCSSFGQ